MADDSLIAIRTLNHKPDISKFHIHTHDGYEIFCFLQGKAKYFVEGTIYFLHPGDILIMKKAESHTLLLLKDTPYERITVHFSPEDLESSCANELLRFLDSRPLGQNNRYSAAVFTGNSWMHYLNMLCKCESLPTKRLYLTVLLTELRDASSHIVADEDIRDNFSEIITYINDHLGEDLSIDRLCQQFHISRSHINRKFRQMTGSSIGEYIRVKRLHLAKRLLAQGESPYRVCERCGFGEYSSFYRAYKDSFGVSPKLDYQKSPLSVL